MGKQWKSKSREERKGHSSRGQIHDFTSCRGHSLVICTCDVVREREGSKELINLLNEALERLHPELFNVIDNGDANANNIKSIQQLLQEEIEQVQSSRQKGYLQHFVSVHTDMKGVILAKVIPKDICVIDLVDEVFQRIERDKKPISKNIVRMIPLKYSFFPKEDEFLEK